MSVRTIAASGVNAGDFRLISDNCSGKTIDPFEIGSSYEESYVYSTNYTIPVVANFSSSGPGGGLGEGYIVLRGYFRPELYWGHYIEFEIAYQYPKDTR